MAIFDSVSRLAGTVIAIFQTRLELLSVEVEEEALRLFSYLIFALAAMFCAGLAILLGVLLIVTVYWDRQRVPVLIMLMLFFVTVSAAIIFGIRRHFRTKPRLLSQTVNELSRDIEQLKTAHREAGL
jgi:uncharacterized membrane protein YqjE